MPQRPPLLALALLVLVAIAPTVRAEGLAEILAAVAANARFEVPARADVRIEEPAAGSSAPAILLGRGRVLYLETREGTRALVRPGKVLVAGPRRVEKARPGARLGDTDLLLEDLAVFTASTLKVPLVSDDTPAELVVSGAPADPSAYALLVFTIDRERRAIVRTLYYSGLVGNLTKVRRDGGFVQVGGHWRPGEITVESPRQGTTTRLTLAWREMPDAPPALFEPTGLRRPSGLSWPPSR